MKKSNWDGIWKQGGMFVSPITEARFAVQTSKELKKGIDCMMKKASKQKPKILGS